MSRIFVGVDPGLDGAVAVVGLDKPLVWDLPTLVVGDRRHYHVPLLIDNFELVRQPEMLVGIESIHAMPKNGSIANHSMGYAKGLLEGIVATLHLPYEMVAPTAWKKAMMAGCSKEKDASRAVAMRLFPETADQLSRKKDHGRADALLIAEFLRRRAG